MESKYRVYLVVMGDIYRLTMPNYKRYLRRLSRDGSADLNDFGALHVSRVYNATDITREQAQIILGGGRVSTLPIVTPPKPRAR